MGKCNLMTSQKLFIQKIFDATLEPSEAPSGKVFYNNEGKQVGNAPSIGDISITLENGQTYEIPKGFHKVVSQIIVKTLAEMTADANARAKNITKGNSAYVNGELIQGILEVLDTSDANAVESYLLSGQIAYTKNNERIVGTMPNNKILDENAVGINTNYPGIPTREGTVLQYCKDVNGVGRINICPPKGYYPGVGAAYVNSPSSKFGTAGQNHVLEGKYFTSENGLNMPGTMKNLPQNTLVKLSSDSTAKVIVDIDTITIPNNTDGIQRICYRYSGNDGFITNNTFFGFPLADFLTRVGLDSSVIAKGKSVLGIAGTATGITKTELASSSSSSSDSDTVPLSTLANYDYVMVEVYDNTSYSGEPIKSLMKVSELSSILSDTVFIYLESGTIAVNMLIQDSNFFISKTRNKSYKVYGVNGTL